MTDTFFWNLIVFRRQSKTIQTILMRPYFRHCTCKKKSVFTNSKKVLLDTKINKHRCESNIRTQYLFFASHSKSIDIVLLKKYWQR